MNKIDKYFDARQDLLIFFGYKEGYRTYPLQDMRMVWWSTDGSTVYYSFIKEHHQQYIATEYTYGAVPEGDAFSGSIESIHESHDKHYAMILVDTQTDGAALLMIFDKTKRLERGGRT